MRNIITPSLENMVTVTIMVAVVWAVIGFGARLFRLNGNGTAAAEVAAQ